ncbi:MAG: hypothetical protein VKI42_08270 [Synechococcaceae cyanobacterium]|nr:hypothetical protein [Synechococcaceae cyanobacterium]
MSQSVAAQEAMGDGMATPSPAPASTPSPSPPTTPTPSPAAANPWAATFELYGFLPWIQSTTTIRDFDTQAALGPGQVINVLQSAFSFRGSAEKDQLGLLFDVAYNQLGANPSRSGPRGLVNLDTELTATSGIYDLAMRWRFGDRESAIGQPGRWSVIPYAGMRLVQARLDVAAQVTRFAPFSLGPERLGSLDHTWVQPMVGTQASLFLSPRLRLFARGDIGGFGLAGAEDLSGNAQVGFGYAVGNNTDLNLSWRYQGLRWSNGAERSNGFSLDENGVEVGVKFFF